PAGRVDLAVDPDHGGADADHEDGDNGEDDGQNPAAAGALSAEVDVVALVVVVLELVVEVVLVLVVFLVDPGVVIVPQVFLLAGAIVIALVVVGRAVTHRVGSPALLRRWSSQACSITDAATLSTTLRRAGAFMLRAMRSRSAVTVVRRSSHISTGRPVAAAS